MLWEVECDLVRRAENLWLRICYSIKTALFKSLCSGACNFRAGASFHSIQGWGCCDQEENGEILMVLQWGGGSLWWTWTGRYRGVPSLSQQGFALSCVTEQFGLEGTLEMWWTYLKRVSFCCDKLGCNKKWFFILGYSVGWGYCVCMRSV